MVIGTPHYMSPEQATASEVDGRSDIYSLGCVVYEMLAGMPPFTGSTAQAVMARHSVDAVPSLRTVRSAVPEPVERVVLRALAKVPADRYATAREFDEALAHAVSSAETGPPPPRRRHRWAVALLGIALGAAVAVVVWSTRGTDSRQAGRGLTAGEPATRRVAILLLREPLARHGRRLSRSRAQRRRSPLDWVISRT